MKLLHKLLCKIGLHSMHCDYGDDGKGNSGMYLECKRCHKIEPF